MNPILMVILGNLLLARYEACRGTNIWQSMLAFASVAPTTSIMVFGGSVLRDDWIIESDWDWPIDPGAHASRSDEARR